MLQKSLRILFVALAIMIGLYPGIYFIYDRHFGLLNSKTTELLASPVWNTGFYTHIIFGGLALLTGWAQFGSKFRDQHLTLHRRIGTVYMIAVLLSSVAGIFIGFFATGGLISASGFVCLGVIWFSTTLLAYLHIRKRQIDQHQKMMIYSYAACFAAVTLRIWLPLLTMAFGNFIAAYRIVAWLCWVPNLVVAYLICRRMDAQTI